MAGDIVKFENAAQPPRRSFDEIMRMAETIAKSRLFGVQQVDQVVALMLMAEAEGRHVASAMQDYSVIQGKPSLKAEAMLARFQQAGGKVKWTCLTDERVAAIFSHSQCEPVEIDWDMERAKRAQLTNPMWKKYPRQMLRARVISEGVRTAFPGALGGMYAPEEVIDFEPAASVSRPAAAPSPQPLAVEVEHTEAGAGDLTPSAPASSSNVPGAVKSVKDFALEEALTQKDYSTEAEWEELLSEMETHATREDVTAWWKTKRELKQAKPHMMRAFSHFALTPYWESLSETVVWDEAEAGARG